MYIGDNFHFGPGIRILARNQNYDNGDAIPHNDTYCYQLVYIENNVRLGVDTTVLSGVHIGEGAIVQAGSTAVSDVPAGAIVSGCPAKQFAERDMEHYYELIGKGKFH